jgi:hypothetical protein
MAPYFKTRENIGTAREPQEELYILELRILLQQATTWLIGDQLEHNCEYKLTPL